MVDSDVNDFMIVTDLRQWWQNNLVGDFFRWRFLQRYESASNISNCRQHKLSSTSITNTDVTLSMQTQCEEGAKYNGLVSIYHQIFPIDAPSIVRQ